MFSGSIVALVTPMRDGGAIDEVALERLVEWHILEKTDAILAVGTTGESATLSGKEKLRVIRRVVKLAGGRVPVIAGTGTCSTVVSLELTRLATEAGADACLLVTPYYNKPTQEGLYAHYSTIAESAKIPLILYNVPSRTACDMQPETVARLAALPGIVGIKEAVADMQRVRALADLGGEDFVVLSGDDPTALEAMRHGARGVVSVTANVAPAAMHALCEAALAGRWEEAEAADGRLAQLHKKLFLESNPIPVKWALEAMGLIPGGLRLPLTRLGSDHHQPLREALVQAGIAVA